MQKIILYPMLIVLIASIALAASTIEKGVNFYPGNVTLTCDRNMTVNYIGVTSNILTINTSMYTFTGSAASINFSSTPRVDYFLNTGASSILINITTNDTYYIIANESTIATNTSVEKNLHPNERIWVFKYTTNVNPMFDYADSTITSITYDSYDSTAKKLLVSITGTGNAHLKTMTPLKGTYGWYKINSSLLFAGWSTATDYTISSATSWEFKIDNDYNGNPDSGGSVISSTGVECLSDSNCASGYECISQNCVEVVVDTQDTASVVEEIEKEGIISKIVSNVGNLFSGNDNGEKKPFAMVSSWDTGVKGSVVVTMIGIGLIAAVIIIGLFWVFVSFINSSKQ